MKKTLQKFLFIAALLLGIELELKAQSYIPMLDSSINTWRFTQNYFPIRLAQSTTLPNCNYGFNMEQELATLGDTQLNGQNYKILIASYGSIPTCLYGYLREDTATRKVYFKDVNNAPEITLYDFGMPVGDSLYINFYNNGAPNAGYFENGNYTLDSIRTVSLSSGPKRAFYLHHKVNFNPNFPRTLIWYEGIGNPFYTIYPYSPNMESMGWFSVCQEFPHDFVTFLTCFDHANKVYYDTCGYWVAHTNGCVFFSDSCNYYNICSTVQEIRPSNQFVVSPNPAKDKVMIHFTGAVLTENSRLTLYNMNSSRIIKETIILSATSESSSYTLDLNEVPDGIYFLEINTQEKRYFQKLVVLH